MLTFRYPIKLMLPTNLQENLFSQNWIAHSPITVQMADDLSTQLLTLNFSACTCTYKCLAQGLSKSVTGFSAFIRHYLNPCLAVDIGTQFMDDIGRGVETFQQIEPNLRKNFECIRRSGLKPSPEKSRKATKTMQFLGNAINPNGISPQSKKNIKVCRQINHAINKKS